MTDKSQLDSEDVVDRYSPNTLPLSDKVLDAYD